MEELAKTLDLIRFGPYNFLSLCGPFSISKSSKAYRKPGGVLPIMAFTGRLRPKGVPFSRFRYMKR